MNRFFQILCGLVVGLGISTAANAQCVGVPVANTVCAGTSSGPTVVATFRQLVAADLPNLPTPVAQDFVASLGDFTPGTTTALTISSTPAVKANMTVTFDGITQAHNTYSLSGTTVTFSAAIPLNVKVVEIQWFEITGLQGVNSINSLTGVLNLTAGTGITITPSSPNIAIATTGVFGSTSHGNADVTLTCSDLPNTFTSATFTANHTWMLPAASACPVGSILTISDAGSLVEPYTLTIQAAGSDALFGPGSTYPSTNTFVLGTQYQQVSIKLVSTAAWAVIGGNPHPMTRNVPLMHQIGGNCVEGHYMPFIDQDWCLTNDQVVMVSSDPSAILILKPNSATNGQTWHLTFTFGSGACAAGCTVSYTTPGGGTTGQTVADGIVAAIQANTNLYNGTVGLAQKQILQVNSISAQVNIDFDSTVPMSVTGSANISGTWTIPSDCAIACPSVLDIAPTLSFARSIQGRAGQARDQIGVLRTQANNAGTPPVNTFFGSIFFDIGDPTSGSEYGRVHLSSDGAFGYSVAKAVSFYDENCCTDTLVPGTAYFQNYRRKPMTYSQLTTAITCNSGTTGFDAVVTDSNTNSWGGIVGSGAPNATVLVWCNGTNWTVAGK